MRNLILVVYILVLALASGCAQRGGTTETDGSPLEGTTWVLTAYGAEQTPAVEGSNSTLVLNEGQVRGQVCNGFGGEYALDGSTLTFGQLVRTLMYCEEPAGLMEQEDTALSLLEQVERYSINGSVLEMTGADGAVLLRWQAQSQ